MAVQEVDWRPPTPRSRSTFSSSRCWLWEPRAVRSVAWSPTRP